MNRVAGACERCATWVKVGDGEVIRYGGRQWLRCPNCKPPAAP